eukprot:s762_g8.t1
MSQVEGSNRWCFVCADGRPGEGVKALYRAWRASRLPKCKIHGSLLGPFEISQCFTCRKAWKISTILLEKI